MSSHFIIPSTFTPSCLLWVDPSFSFYKIWNTIQVSVYLSEVFPLVEVTLSQLTLYALFSQRPHHRTVHFLFKYYPEIGDADFKSALWTFKQQLALKYKYVREFLLFSYKRLCTVPFGIPVANWVLLVKGLVITKVYRMYRSPNHHLWHSNQKCIWERKHASALRGTTKPIL